MLKHVLEDIQVWLAEIQIHPRNVSDDCSTVRPWTQLSLSSTAENLSESTQVIAEVWKWKELGRMSHRQIGIQS